MQTIASWPQQYEKKLFTIFSAICGRTTSIDIVITRVF